MRLRIIVPPVAVLLASGFAVWLQFYSPWGTTTPWVTALINMFIVGGVISLIHTLRADALDTLWVEFDEWVRNQVHYSGAKKLPLLQQLGLPSSGWAIYNKRCLELFEKTTQAYARAVRDHSRWWKPLDTPDLASMQGMVEPLLTSFKREHSVPED